MRAGRRFCVVLAMSLLMCACGYDTLYSNLDEQQANDMLALLLREGFDARKVRTDANWVLEISRTHLPRAVDTLNTHGYPRDGYQSLGDIFKKEGFVSSPLEERARLVHGLSQELSKTIANIDGVVVSRVHLALPERNPLSDERAPSSASIFIKHRPAMTLTQHTSAIKALVVNSVEGLPYDNVTVSFFEADPPPARAPEAVRRTLDWHALDRVQVVSAAAVLGVAAFVIVFWRRRPGPSR